MNRLAAVCAIVLACLVGATSADAFWYGEHKEIGETAFARVLEARRSSPFFALLRELVPVQTRPDSNMAVFAATQTNTYLTYGDLTALLADHDTDAYDFAREMADANSIVYRAYQMQEAALRAGLKSASNVDLTLGSRFQYLGLASLDKAHFYHLGLTTFRDQLSDIDELAETLITLALSNDANINQRAFEFFNRSTQTNGISKYSLLHLDALQLAGMAGSFMKEKPKVAMQLLYWAILFNAFADHYLEDAFAAGHLTVDHWTTEPAEANGRHDYYCRVGLVVQNERGDGPWQSYGDNYLDASPRNKQLVIEAVMQSVNEIVSEFEARSSDPSRAAIFARWNMTKANTIIPVRDSILSNTNGWFQALKIVPIPKRPDELRFGRSLNGTQGIFSAGAISFDNKVLGQVIAAIGFGLINFGEVSSSLDTNSESNFAISFNAEATAAYADAHRGFLALGFVPRILFWDRVLVAPNVGFDMTLDHRSVIGWNIALGYQWKDAYDPPFSFTPGIQLEARRHAYYGWGFGARVQLAFY